VKILQSNIFKRRVKKMHKLEKEALDNAIKEIVEEPLGDIAKTGDLAGVRVFKYKFNRELYLIAYEYIEDEIVLNLIEHGTHENFYRDLKRN